MKKSLYFQDEKRTVVFCNENYGRSFFVNPDGKIHVTSSLWTISQMVSLADSFKPISFSKTKKHLGVDPNICIKIIEKFDNWRSILSTIYRGKFV